VAKFWPKAKEEATPAAVCNDIEPIAHVESLSGQQQVCLLCSYVRTYVHTYIHTYILTLSIRFHDTTSACRSYLA
jgi:hypothetical protein